MKPFCRPDRSYVVTGGVGGFGLALADWLVDQGARHLVLTSKRGVRNGIQHSHLRDIFDKGAYVSHFIGHCPEGIFIF